MSRKHEKEANHERWLLTYSDLITLLMIFFVVMYASSNVDASKYKAISDSFSVALGGGGGGNIINIIEPIYDNSEVKSENETKNGNYAMKTEEDQMDDIKQNLDKYLQNNGLKDNVVSVINERGLVVSLNDTVFFDSGKAQIIESSKNKLVEIGKIINNMGNYIRIEGHTDNIPIHNSTFTSNWQLSVVRASNVTELLIGEAKISPEKISAVGYGEYRPVADNNTVEGRSKNRRVDIVILNSKFDGAEQNKK